MQARAITTLLLIALTGWVATPALGAVECRAMPARVRASCPPSCPHCKKADRANGPAVGKSCCVVRATHATPPAEPHARQLPGPEVAVVDHPAVFLAGVARIIPRELPRLAARPPPLQINRPLLR